MMPFLLLFVLLAAALPMTGIAYAQDRIPTYAAHGSDGNPISLDDLAGSPALINIWATWCEPCRRELPYLQSLHIEYSDSGLRVIGASIDAADDAQLVGDFADSMGITYEIWLDPGDKATYAFRMLGVPETILIGPDGAILHQWRGPMGPGMGVERIIENALGTPSAAAQPDMAVVHSVVQPETAGLAIAFSAGLLSFLSPCVLPLIPTYATFITGMGLKEMSSRGASAGLVRPKRADRSVMSDGAAESPAGTCAPQSVQRPRATVLVRGLLFILGFSTVFVSLGVAVSHVSYLFDAAVWVERIGEVIIILFGLHLLGILRIKKLYVQRSLNPSNISAGHTGSILVGMGFGAGWTPCIGPILAGILTIAAASSSVGTGAVLLVAYSAGLAVPFMLSALAMDRFMAFLHVARRWMGWIERTTGILLIGMGVMLMTGSLSVLASLFGESLMGAEAP